MRQHTNPMQIVSQILGGKMKISPWYNDKTFLLIQEVQKRRTAALAFMLSPRDHDLIMSLSLDIRALFLLITDNGVKQNKCVCVI